MSKIIRYNDVNIKNINYSKPEKNGSTYFSPLSYGENLTPLYIQTPRLKCLTNYDDIKDKKNPMIDVEITDGNFDLYDFFLSIDDTNIKKTFQNSQEWFSKELPLDAIDDMYKRSTKPFKRNTNPVLKMKLPVIKNQIQCSIYNQDKVFIDINQLKKGSEIILIIHIRGLRISKQCFYCDSYISQIKLHQENTKYNVIKDYSLLDDDEKVDIEYDGECDDEILVALQSEDEKMEEEKNEKNDKIKELEQLLQNTQSALNDLIK